MIARVANAVKGSHPLRLGLFLLLCALLSWYSWLLGYASDPSNSGINPLGALVAALLVCAASGWTNLKDYLRRITKVRAHWSTYAAALLVPIAVSLASVMLYAATGHDYPFDRAMVGWIGFVDAFLFMLLFVGIGEEPAWRGWLLPFFRDKLTPLAAALAVAPIWALWHLPMWGRQIPVEQLLPFFISITAGSIFLAWLTNRARGGVLPAMLGHASVNAVGSAYLYSFVTGQATTTLWWINALVWATAALLLVIFTRGQLGDRSAGDEATRPQ